MNEPSTTQRPKQVWILDEGSQGHLVQSRGLIRELSTSVPVEVTEVRIKEPFQHRIGRSLVKRLLRSTKSMGIFRLLHRGMELPAGTPDLLISSGPHSLPALEFLSKHYGCPSVFAQGTLHVPEGAVTVIMRPYEGKQRADFIFIPLLFTEITPAVVNAERDAFLAKNPGWPREQANTLFIGASSAKIRFTDADWDGVVRLVNDLWKRDGRKWLITTSYRTGREVEERFKKGIQPEAILDAVWYSEAPRKVTKTFLGLADRVFVTMDSLTMLTEAVASGRPAYALCPGESGTAETNTHLRYVHHLAENGFIHPVKAGGVTDLPPTHPPVIDYSDAISELLNRLRWNP